MDGGASERKVSETLCECYASERKANEKMLSECYPTWNGER